VRASRAAGRNSARQSLMSSPRSPHWRRARQRNGSGGNARTRSRRSDDARQ
jgi:hypothetical protein